jgi:diacylglycerol kinase (ATP)
MKAKTQTIHIIINPAAGRMEPILPVINAVMKDTGMDWEVLVTKDAKDAQEFAKDAVKKEVDIVAVYGGDGTLMEVISGLMGSDIPLAILPGGSANILAKELNIPVNLKEACELICGPHDIGSIDVGQFNKKYFSLRLGLGFEADMVTCADRGVKNKIGMFAYWFSTVTALGKIKEATYHIKVDGEEHKVRGFTCIIANAGNVGFGELSLDKNIDIHDGLLDILVVRKISLSLMAHLFATILKQKRAERWELVAHWQGRDISVTATPKQTIQCDGELLAKMPIHAKVIPAAIKVIVPKPQEKG